MEILFQRSVTLFQAVATESTGVVREMVVLPVVPLELPLLPVFPVLLLSQDSFFTILKVTVWLEKNPFFPVMVTLAVPGFTLLAKVSV